MMEFEKQSIGLFSAPWPIYNRPSIQLGALKAWLNKNVPHLHVDVGHFYLNLAEQIGYPTYQRISEKTWLAESVYAALLFEDRKDKIERFFNTLLKKRGKADIDFNQILKKTKTVSDILINTINWEKYRFVGFSMCLCQLTSSMYFIREIRKKAPDLFILAGGSIISGHQTKDLRHFFPEVNYFIKGEGELPLERLAKSMEKTDWITYATSLADQDFGQTEYLDELPVPDYEDYFNALSLLPPSKRFFPNLPIEFSRGCWWHKDQKGCSFCNLNAQWEGYRVKSPEKVAREIDELSSRHKILSFSVMDNVLPLKKMGEYFSGITSLKKDFSLFCELRATTPYPVLREMRRAGVSFVQVGIESLSTPLLKKMNKGTIAIQNIEIMRHCEELGMVNGANIMIHFPGSGEEDVRRTLQAIDFVIPFRPLNIVPFQLGKGSLVAMDPQKFGISRIRNHRNFSILFPEDVEASVQFVQQEYRGNILLQKKIWKDVEKKVAEWKKTYETLHQHPGAGPILEYKDGGHFLIIRHRVPNRETETHRLEGMSREIYLYCRHYRSVKRILNHFQSLTEEKLLPFLDMLVSKKLMFREKDFYLSLAVSKPRI